MRCNKKRIESRDFLTPRYRESRQSDYHYRKRSDERGRAYVCKQPGERGNHDILSYGKDAQPGALVSTPTSPTPSAETGAG